MKLFEECMIGVERLLTDVPVRIFGCTLETVWPDEGRNQMIFQSEAAYELGAGELSALSGVLFTDNADSVENDEILVYGKDLSELDDNSPYARITFVRIKESNTQDTNALFQLLRRIDYSRYHINPKGFMMRISAKSRREVVRVSKTACKEGITFQKVGKLFVDAYHKHPEVEAVKVIFITLPDFPYNEMEELLIRAEDMTKALDHLAKKVTMDCRACNLKEVCAEVEALCNTEKTEEVFDSREK